MPKELQGVTDAIGGVFDSPAVQLGLKALAVYWIIFWLAASYWAYRDLQLRTDNPVMPYLAAAFVILFTPLLFPAAIVIYRIVRPHEKIDEVYERTLAQEAMLAEIETVRNCPTCRRRVHEDWIVCPTCRTRLARVCPNCDRLVGLDWSLCAWCGRDFERREAVVSGPSTASLPSGSRPAVGAMATPIATATDVEARRPPAASPRPAPQQARSARSTPPRGGARPAPGSLPDH